jgi:type VI secretion system protein VasD
VITQARVPGPATRTAGIALLVTFAAAGAACKSKPPPVEIPKPITAVVSIVAAPDLNPNRDGRPSPVFLRLLLLRDGARFLNAGFDDVTAKSDQVLSASLLGRDERMVQPGSAITVTLEVPPEARMLGVVAEYSDLPDSRWRAATPVTEGGLLSQFKGHSLLVSVGRQSVSTEFVAAKSR